MDSIDWKPFTLRIIDFEIDRETQKLFAITDSLTILSFSTPENFQTLTNQTLTSYPIDLKVVNGSLFLVSGGDVV